MQAGQSGLALAQDSFFPQHLEGGTVGTAHGVRAVSGQESRAGLGVKEGFGRRGELGQQVRVVTQHAPAFLAPCLDQDGQIRIGQSLDTFPAGSVQVVRSRACPENGIAASASSRAVARIEEDFMGMSPKRTNLARSPMLLRPVPVGGAGGAQRAWTVHAWS